MHYFILIVICISESVLAQKSADDAINSIFATNNTDGNWFSNNYEEITQPPLKSYGVLEKCGEGSQRNNFVCVPYYNCNPNTNLVQENNAIDGANRIDIRAGDSDRRCDHYLDVCCQLPSASIQSSTTTSTTRRPSSATPFTSPERPVTRRVSSSSTTSTTSRPRNPSPSPTPTSSTNSSSAPAFCGIRNSKGIDFTLNGKNNEAEFGEFPWMVAILRNNPRANERLLTCGGSLITPRAVLTGAHCVSGLKVGDIRIRAGEWDTQTTNERIPFQERNVTNIIIHEHYIPKSLYNDVALLILDRPLTKTDHIGTTCLPLQEQRFDSQECFATGWGKDIFGQKGRYSVILKKRQLPLVDSNTCQNNLRKTRLGDAFVLHRTFLCAGGQPGVDTCTGDGGSPLVCPDPNNPNRYLQVGIVAWGIGCGEKGIPGVYVDVSQFRNWIDLRLQEQNINTTPYTL